MSLSLSWSWPSSSKVGWISKGISRLGVSRFSSSGDAGHGLGIIAEQERSLVGAGQHAVLAFADDGQAALGRQRGPQTVGALLNGQLTKLARPGLDPELGVRHLGDESGVAGLGLLAEVNLSRPSRLGLRPDPDEQKMGAGLGGEAQHDDCREPATDHRPSRPTIHGKPPIGVSSGHRAARRSHSYLRLMPTMESDCGMAI